MTKIGAQNARTHFPDPLDKVNKGEKIINELLALRKQITLHSISWKELRDTGR